jgi:hypothetical protein
MLIEATLAELKRGETVDRPALERKWREHERQFSDTSAGSYATQSRGDYFTLSRALFKKHHSMALKTEASAGHGKK